MPVKEGDPEAVTVVVRVLVAVVVIVPVVVPSPVLVGLDFVEAVCVPVVI